jgi:hypothetical protein
MTFQWGMARKLIICTAVTALALAAPAWAASPLDEYQQTGHITPCRYSSAQLQGAVPNDVAQYAPEYASQLQAAARERASGCGGSASGVATGAGPGTAAPVAAATAPPKVRARARPHPTRRVQARRAAATIPAANMSGDARVPDRALLLAALPILLLLGLIGALTTRRVVRRRAGQPYPPATSRRRKTRYAAKSDGTA